MGCCCSAPCFFRKKQKNEATQENKSSTEINSLLDGTRRIPSEEQGCSLEKLQEQHEQHLRTLHEALRAAGIRQRESLLQTYHHQLRGLVQDIIEKVKVDTTADLNVLFEMQLTAVMEEHQSRTEELQKQYEEEKKSLTNTFQAEQMSLQCQVDTLREELQLFNELKQRVEESSLKRDLQRNIQAQGNPGAFWEQELESLLFVIEMKSKQLQDHGKKLQHAKAMVERNISLEDQMTHVLQQNEDLSARIENYQALIQELSREHDSLQESLKKEALVNQKLNQEKEELLYKLLQRETGPTFHPSAVKAQLTPS
ncbi:hypothetical protein MATL_G00171470 [Megalops atlanticus]|uniref:Coiled-coil domain-containing protein 69 n=1 Tax=Megalops atlanticus TaxID=7932 RepID=A0A9D3T767_MEGAT|nr:hypothetical protein MATL_G00171470 [Megalops atlanticus]